MKRNADRAARLSPKPEHQAPRLRQKHELLRVPEKGPLALQRQDLPQRKSPQPPRLAEELEPGWREAPSQLQHVRGLEHLYFTHRLGAGGGQAWEHRPDSEGPAQRGAARPPRAREKLRAAVREQKSRKEALAGRQSRLTRPQRKATGPEKMGAPRAAGLTRRPLCPREQNKGKRPPLMKARGGHHPTDPWGSRGVDTEESLAVPGAFGHLQRREKEGARDRRRRPGKGATPTGQGPTNGSLDQSPEGETEDPEQSWHIGRTHRGGAVPLASLCRRGDKSRWQRELELAFRELLNTNRELRKHLSLHVALGPAAEQRDQSAGDELSPCDTQEPRGESQRDKPAVGPEVDVEPGAEPTGPAQAKAHQIESRTSLEEFLSNLKNQKYLRPATFPSKTMSEPLSPKAGVFIGAENRLLGGLGSREALARPDPLAEGPRRRCLQEQADRASLAALWQRPDGPPEPVHRMGPPGLSWEAWSQAGLEGQKGQRRAGPAHLTSYSSLDPGEEGACACDTTSPWASGFIDDDRHSQMIHDLQQQIEEQNKLHKQFLAEARKRLQEFQRI
ncbi:protein DDC8 homolog [Meles meles]|uniref:protein DDC8 homolog n=1 Tax=Meles meles TaxID=9662 RepID=UPI001E698EE8|nr:protein DDC8 homolog [Meles meles]